MTEVALWLMLYSIAGFVWVSIEQKNLNFDFKELSTRESVFAVLQQIVHYLRGFLTWPLYMVEDVLIYLSNQEDN